MLIVGGFAAPAQAYTETREDYYSGPPIFYYPRTSPLNSTMTAYMTVGSAHYRITQRGGSGDGTTNDCTSNRGWLPGGQYGGSGKDAGTSFSHYNKTTGSTVIRGWIWSLGSHKCTGGSTTRTELFIHSQGTSGWTNSNYQSNGCIKINQTDRSHLHTRFNAASQKSSAYLYVY